MAQTQLNNVLEKAIDALPDIYRVVLVARVIEEMSVDETAALFDLEPATVKTRLHRARALLRRELEENVGPMLADTYQFDGVRCERMAERVIARLNQLR
jgi:RNA polymerase sigma-70 factor (ECF subfamily)